MKKYLSIILLSFVFVLATQIQAQSFLPTNLKITVIDGLGNFVEGATVKIFNSEDDYMNGKNPVAEMKSGKKGAVKFKKLKPISYYIDARTEDKNNDGEGVATEVLLEGRTNKVNVVIE